MILDILKPALYFLEKTVAGKLIPNVSRVPGRKLLKDHPLQQGDASFDHSLWTAVLQRHVKTNGSINAIQNVNVVDYASLAKDSDFQSYLDLLAKSVPEELPAAEQLAFWMNAYNALCINLIVSHEQDTGEQIKSINDLSQPKQPVWDKIAGQVNHADISLNEIEHEKLRKLWAEPAVHACIVCASASCPNLRREAFVAERLREQMNDQAKDWLSNSTKGLSVENGRLFVSRVLLWFEDDFSNGIRAWIPQYLQDENLANEIGKGKFAVRYFDYDWSINRAPESVS